MIDTKQFTSRPMMHFEMFAPQLRHSRRELAGRDAFENTTRRTPCAGANPFLLRSLPNKSAEIPGRFSSSLPPPSFVRGRSAAIFMTTDAAARGIGFFLARRCAA